MDKIQYPPPVKLIVGMISADESLFNLIQGELSKEFGEIDFESEVTPFNHTNYYEKELGKGALRKFISFKELIDGEKLSSIKIFTNKLERRFSQSGRRRINIDPGYVSRSKLILATTKNYQHRIYLRDGIYGEVTLRLKREKGFQPWEWTYPDYKTEKYLTIFNQIHKIYLNDLRLKK